MFGINCIYASKVMWDYGGLLIDLMRKEGHLAEIRDLINEGTTRGWLNDSESVYDVALSLHRNDVINLLLENSIPLDINDRGAWEQAIPQLTQREKDLFVVSAVVSRHHTRVDVLEFLLRNGANVDGPNRGGMPLLNAAAYNNIDVVELLLRYGANTNIVGPEGRNARDIADYYKHPRIVTLIDQHNEQRNKNALMAFAAGIQRGNVPMPSIGHDLVGQVGEFLGSGAKRPAD